MSKTLEVRGLQKVYAGPGRSVEALRELTFSVEASELVCVVGPSGCGKTTLLRCVAGLLEPTAGEVLLQGARVADPPPDLAVVFQEYGRSLFPWMTVRGNVELPLRAKRLPGPAGPSWWTRPWPRSAWATSTPPTHGSCRAGCS